MAAASIDTPKNDIVELITTDMRRIQAALNEIKGQVDQMQILVDREQQRNSDVATELRTVQENIDTIPRQDIRSKYDEMLDTRFRLSTMRGQLEKLQTRQELLQEHQTMLNRLLNMVQGAELLPSASNDRGAAPVTSYANIIRIVQAQEEERQRLARQMHDGPAQSLTNFILQAEICQRLFDRNPDKAAEELANLKSTASVTFQKVRDFIFDLRPMMLDDLGVVPTVRRYVESFRDKNDIDTNLEIMGEERRLETAREVLIFRGIQELMVQARDYASPNKLRIQLDMGGSHVKALVEDDGRGFDAEAALAGDDNHSADARVQSIMTLKEKYELVGGSVSVTSSETEGTAIRLELPSEDNVF
jgi:two-component system, NarL family, sensor histidine kinase DegS